jgi:hypothetical protein
MKDNFTFWMTGIVATTTTVMHEYAMVVRAEGALAFFGVMALFLAVASWINFGRMTRDYVVEKSAETIEERIAKRDSI